MELLTRIDYYLLLFMHDHCIKWAKYLTPFSKVLSFIGKDGIVLFIIAAILMLFRKTRKIGICVFGAIGAGAILSNIIVKDLIARPRPFETYNDIRTMWEAFGIKEYSQYSFPSGHCTAAMAFASAFGFAGERDSKHWTLLLPLSMCFARCYLLMHYPSDCVAGLVFGFAGALVSWIITSIIFKILNHWDEVPLFDFLLYWDLIDAIKEARGINITDEEFYEDDEDEEEQEPVRKTSVKKEKVKGKKVKTDPKSDKASDGRTIFRAGD